MLKKRSSRIRSAYLMAAEEEPPVSNSLMAAIKRSQANQRRHPESYHLQQIHHGGGGSGAQTTTAVIRVELKYFILSILDDPVVSRVLNDAGYRSSEIKLDVLSYFLISFLLLFLCNLPDSDPGRGGFGFPFCGNSEVDENCRRIGDVLSRKEKKNPLLVGVCANAAMKTFTDLMNRGKLGFLPLEFTGVSVLSIEKEISEILVDGSRNEEETRKKLDELDRIIKQKCAGSGVILNLGEFKGLTCEASSSSSSSSSNGNALESLVSKLSSLLELHRGNLWFIGSISSNETFPQLLDRFPTIEKDWDLHVLPITSTKPSGVYPKSRSFFVLRARVFVFVHCLMGSFVPFGGLFASTSDFRVPSFGNATNQPMPRCHLCNEKYEQEVASFIKVGSSFSAANQCSEKLPSWLRSVDPNSHNKGIDSKVRFYLVSLSLPLGAIS
ncbi:PREDICTED: protein SMAX1-LIKE 6-like [Tarenaya hassleriana]|uniref:protein SMAX1-LIKE 6-like n=1 Tax=Tarenaya hassleriana TaxID=28532 RepID=UPI00053C1C4D|nr:PREDICTED: protein SMAX1-LIKE 6-like [Tarenaya hassleriana]